MRRGWRSVCVLVLTALIVAPLSPGIGGAQNPSVYPSAGIRPLPVPKTLSVEEFPAWLRKYLHSLQWVQHHQTPRLSREVLGDSFALGRQFMLSNQKPAGNFNYQYDFVHERMDTDDNQVRQAGALWGLALMYQYEQDAATKKALDRSLRFFFAHTRPGPADGSLLIAYPGDSWSRTGTVALIALGIIEYLRTEQAGQVQLLDQYREELVRQLKGYLVHLQFMQLKDSHFSQAYSLKKKAKSRRSSPYFDGETMLCLIKAAKYLKHLGYTDLIPLIEKTALVLAKNYTADAWRKDPDSDKTKGFFQWSCMAFWEYQDAGWKHTDTFGDYVLSVSWWMIYVHHTLNRTRNTAYAYEGLVHAYRIARARNHRAAIDDLAYTIDRGLFKLTSWQVGGPLQSRNHFLSNHATQDLLAIGGVMNHKREALLRIDVAQHQMHAVLLALQHVYPGTARVEAKLEQHVAQ